MLLINKKRFKCINCAKFYLDSVLDQSVYLYWNHLAISSKMADFDFLRWQFFVFFISVIFDMSSSEPPGKFIVSDFFLNINFNSEC